VRQGSGTLILNSATFTLVSTTGGITGFENGAITGDASALPAATELTWSAQVQGNNLVLVYGAPVGTPFEQWASANGLTGPDTDLAGTWTPAQGGVNRVTIHETENGFATGIDRVEVHIPSSQAAAGRLLARLAVTE
jgi:hypothetical protein